MLFKDEVNAEQEIAIINFQFIPGQNNICFNFLSHFSRKTVSVDYFSFSEGVFLTNGMYIYMVYKLYNNQSILKQMCDIIPRLLYI